MVGQTEAVNSFNDCSSAAVAQILFISFNLSSDISIADGDAIADISHFFGSAFHIDYWLGCLCASPGAALRLMPRSAFAVNGACDMIAIETQYCANCSMWSHWSRNNRKNPSVCGIRTRRTTVVQHKAKQAEQTTWSFQRPADSRCGPKFTAARSATQRTFVRNAQSWNGTIPLYGPFNGSISIRTWLLLLWIPHRQRRQSGIRYENYFSDFITPAIIAIVSWILSSAMQLSTYSRCCCAECQIRQSRIQKSEIRKCIFRSLCQCSALWASNLILCNLFLL